MSKKNKHHTQSNKKCCDPAFCDNCLYICEGDFFCDKFNALVVSDWTPTEDYMKCKKGGASDA